MLKFGFIQLVLLPVLLVFPSYKAGVFFSKNYLKHYSQIAIADSINSGKQNFSQNFTKLRLARQGDTIQTRYLGRKARLCACSANSLFFANNTKIFLISQDTTISQDLLVPIKDLDTYAGLINSVLTAGNQILIFDNFLQQLSTVDLNAPGIYSPLHLKILSSSDLAVYNDFDGQIYVINFLNSKIRFKIPVQNYTDVKSISFDGQNIFFLSNDKIFKITPLQQIKFVTQVAGAIQIATIAGNLWVLTGKQIVLIKKDLKKRFFLDRNFTAICGQRGNQLILKAQNSQLYATVGLGLIR